MFFAGAIAGDRPPRYGMPGSLRITVGRGPVPRRASVGREMALVGVLFSRRSNDRGGQAPALRARKGVLLAMRRSGSGDPELRSLGYASNRGGQAPALRTNRDNLGNLANPAANLGNLGNPAHAWHGEGQALALRTGGRPHLEHACN